MKPGEQEGRGEGRRHRAAGDGASSIGFWSAGEGGQFNGVLVNAARPLLYTLPTLVYCSSSLRLQMFSRPDSALHRGNQALCAPTGPSPEFTQTHDHWVADPLSSPSPECRRCKLDLWVGKISGRKK